MGNYDTYKNSNNPKVKDYMLRQMFNEHEFLMGAVQTMAEKINELEHRKGVPNELKVMQWKSKPPDFIA